MKSLLLPLLIGATLSMVSCALASEPPTFDVESVAPSSLAEPVADAVDYELALTSDVSVVFVHEFFVVTTLADADVVPTSSGNSGKCEGMLVALMPIIERGSPDPRLGDVF